MKERYRTKSCLGLTTLLVAVVGPRYQIAQKLRACTEWFETGPENDRYRDLMDLLLLRDVLTNADLPRVREACLLNAELRSERGRANQTEHRSGYLTDQRSASIRAGVSERPMRQEQRPDRRPAFHHRRRRTERHARLPRARHQ